MKVNYYFRLLWNRNTSFTYSNFKEMKAERFSQVICLFDKEINVVNGENRKPLVALGKP